MATVKFRTYHDEYDYAVRDEARSCIGKLPHANAEAAEKARLSMQKKTGEPFDKYQCGFCNRWHIGHSQKYFEIPEHERI